MPNLHMFYTAFLLYSNSGIMELNAAGSLDVYPVLYVFAQQLLKPNFIFGMSLRPQASERLLASESLSVRIHKRGY